MDMRAEAFKIADMVITNPKEWEQARLEAFDKHFASNPALAESAYTALTEKVEAKEERRAAARKRAEEARQKREAKKLEKSVDDSQQNDSQQNHSHNEGETHT